MVKTVTLVRKFIYNLGLQDSEGLHFGAWVITNFLSNTMPSESGRRYKLQFWLYRKLLPILNPARMGKK
jgi:hypothetical protein